MAKKRCDYCHELYDEEFEGTLENGSPACPNCVEDEEKRKQEKEDKREMK